MLARQAVQVKNASMLLIISLLVLAGGVVFAFIARPKESKTDRER